MMNEQQIIKEESSSQDSNSKSEITSQNKKEQQTSQHTQAYYKFMGQNLLQSCLSIQQRYIKYPIQQSENITYLHKFHPYLTINCLKLSHQANSLEVSWGYVSMEINALRIQISSTDIHSCNDFVGKGSHSQVYRLEHEGNSYALKSINIDRTFRNDGTSDFSEIKFILQEYFLTRLASFLGVGPKVYNILGFDIIIYDGCADFVIELCQQISFAQASKTKIQQDYKSNLKRMHDFNFCHCDIKPENMMWSPSLEKYVLIDFGISKILKQNIGQKTLTMFLGTYVYCGAEMKKTYWLRSKKYVDMYFNDVESLLKALQISFSPAKRTLSKAQNCGSKEKSRVKFERDYSMLVNFYVIKFYIFTQRYNYALLMLYQQKNLIGTLAKIFAEEIEKNKQYFLAWNVDESLFEKLKLKFKKPFEIYNHTDYQMIKYLSSFYYCKFATQRSYFNFEKYLINKNYSNKFWNKKQVIERIIKFLNPFQDPVDQTDKKIKQNRRVKFIEDYYYEKKNQLQEEVKFLNEQPTFLYKAHILLRETFNFAKQFKSKKLDLEMRQIFMNFGDYISCLQVEKHVLYLYQQENLAWYFLFLIIFHFQRGQWFSHCVLFPDYERLNEMKKVEPKCQLGSCLKEIALIVLSISHSQAQTLMNFEVVKQKVFKLSNSNLALPEMKKRLQYVQLQCNCIISMINNSEGIEEIQTTRQFYKCQLTNYLASIPYDPKSFSGGYFLLFCFLDELSYGQGIYAQFLNMMESNQHHMIWIIQFLLTSVPLCNIWLKVRLFKVYLQKFEFYEESLAQIKECLTVFIRCMSVVIQLNEKPPTPEIKNMINLDSKFKSMILNFYQKINNKVVQRDFESQVPIEIVIISSSMVLYIKEDLNACIFDVLSKLSDYISFESNIQKLRHTQIFTFLEELKKFNHIFTFQSQKLDLLIVKLVEHLMHRQKVKTISSFQLPQILPQYINILIKRNKNIQIIFEKLISLVFICDLFFSNAKTMKLLRMEYYTEALNNFCAACTSQNMQNILKSFCQKISIDDVIRNHFFCFIIIHLYNQSCKHLIFYEGNMKLRKRLFLLCLLGFKNYRCPDYGRIYFRFLSSENRILYPYYACKFRRIFILFRKQTKFSHYLNAKLVTHVKNCVKKLFDGLILGRKLYTLIQNKLMILITNSQYQGQYNQQA